MKRYIKDNKICNASQIIIIKDGMATTNPTEDMILSDGWIEYEEVVPETVIPELTEEEKLSIAKRDKKRNITYYDNSTAVNGCYLIKDGEKINYWANKSERDSLKGAVRDFITAGRETYRLDLREFGVSLTMPCEKLLEMLCALEVYAIDCFNNTTDHLYAVDAMTTVEEIESYDHTAGYPEKLTFNYE